MYFCWIQVDSFAVACSSLSASLPNKVCMCMNVCASVQVIVCVCV